MSSAPNGPNLADSGIRYQFSPTKPRLRHFIYFLPKKDDNENYEVYMAKNTKTTPLKYGNVAAKRQAAEVTKANSTAAAKKEIANIKLKLKETRETTQPLDFQL